MTTAKNPDPILRSFERLAARSPRSPLVVSRRRRVDVGEVEALSRAAGRALAAGPGVPREPGAVVGLAAAGGPGFLAGFLALRRAGLAVLLLDRQTPESERLRIARALGAAAILDCDLPWPAGPEAFALRPVPPQPESPAPLFLPGIAAVKVTSGSTGAPRGIAVAAEALAADDAALAATMGLRAGDVLLATVPMSHSYGLSSLALPALVRGTPLAVPDAEGPVEPLAAALAAGATVFPAVPAYVDALLRLSHPPAWPETLRLVVTAGAPLAPATARRFRDTFGLPVHVFYGASECGGICYDREGGAGERGTVGTPVDGVRLTLEPLEPGSGLGSGSGSTAAGGVVTVSSPAVAAGYVPEGDPKLRDGRFTAGDLAELRGGELALLGRVDDLVNIKGRKVNPREVESVLAGLAGIEEVAVLGVPRPGREGEVLRAVIACREGGLTPERVLAWCREHLAAHKVPRSVILLPEMPRTPRGKLDRPALLALAGEPGGRFPQG